MAMMETTKATIIPVNRIVISDPVKLNPKSLSFNKLAPNMIGIDIKNENSAATKREVPNKIAPKIVAPEREVPGTKERTWNTPIKKAVL